MMDFGRGCGKTRMVMDIWNYEFAQTLPEPERTNWLIYSRIAGRLVDEGYIPPKYKEIFGD